MKHIKITPKGLMHFHLWATVAWFILIVPSLLWWKESIMWVVLMSVWANLAGHFSAWQGARVEVEQEREQKDK